MASELVSVPLTDGSTMLVLPEVMQLKEETIANRRWFHQYPEIAFTEVKTAAKVVELLLQVHQLLRLAVSLVNMLSSFLILPDWYSSK
jgi:hypothetical protein